jgi:phenylacetic acid degradation operon negative regulatory protein
MKARTEEFLYYLSWTLDRWMHPTFLNLTDSFESWAYKNGLLRQIKALEERKFLESIPGISNKRLVRLTEKGRIHSLGGRDPREWWSRPWDKLWRLVVYDVPRKDNATRDQFRSYLKARNYGFLQDSVWISPHPFEEERSLIKHVKPGVRSLILLEARPAANERPQDVVLGAWPFKGIQGDYAHYIEHLKKLPQDPLINLESVERFRGWANLERSMWLKLMEVDPLLPDCLLPRGYLGQKAWRKRSRVHQKARDLLSTFTL